MNKTIFFLIIGILLALPVALANAPDYKSESEWYLFENDWTSAGDEDNTATSTGVTVNDSQKKLGSYSADFTLGDYLTVGGQPSWTNVSYAGWYYPEQFDTGGWLMYLNGGQNYHNLYSSSVGSSVTIVFCQGTGATNICATGNLTQVVGAGNELNNWVHISFTAHINNLVTIWLNGVRFNSASTISSTGTKSATWWIGNDEGGVGNYHGLMDDYRKWHDYVLTDDDVITLYNSGTGTLKSLNDTSDTTPPTSDATAINNTIPKINENVNPSAKFTDETSLSSIWASYNITGTWANFSSTNFTGTVLTGNFSPNITNTLSRGKVVGFKFTANDTSGNAVQSSVFTYAVADTLVVFTLATNNTNPKINDVVKLSSLVNEPDGLSMIIASWNGTNGVWQNKSNITHASGTLSNYSVNLSVGLTRGNVIGYLFYANDTAAFTASSALNTFTVADTLPTTPTSDSLTPNSPVITNTLTGSCSGSTDADSDAITYNYRFYDITDGAERQAFSATTTYALVASTDAHDQFRVDCRATTAGGNSGDRTGTDLETVANTASSLPNIVNATGKSYRFNQTFNITPSTDIDLDTLRYYWFLNSSTDKYPNLVANGITITSWNTNITATSTYYLFVNVSDGYANTTGNSFSFSFDAVPPTVVSTAINNSAPKINEVVQISINITDDSSLSSCWYANNISTFKNISSINLTAIQTQLNYSVNITNTLVRGNVVKNQFTCNDTNGSSTQSANILWTVANTLPIEPTGDTLIPASPVITDTMTGGCSGSTDADGDSLTYYYRFYSITDSAYRGGGFTTGTTYALVSPTDSHDTLRVDCYTNDGTGNGNTRTGTTQRTVGNTVPTAPTSDSLTPNNPIITNTLTGSCSGSTDADGDSMTYYYTFYSITDSATRQAYSTTTTYPLVASTDAHDQFRVDCKVHDGTGYGSELTGLDLETIQNTNPTQANIVNTTNQYRNKNLTINITPSTDADLDILTYYWYRNSSTDKYPNLVANGITTTSYTTNETSDGIYHYFVNVSDGTINISGNMWYWTLDTTTPTIPNDNLTALNNTYIRNNKTIFIESYDLNNFNASLNISQGSTTYLFVYNDTPVNGYLGILRNLNLTGLIDGKYNITFESVDTHSIPPTNLGKGKKGEDKLIFNDDAISKNISIGVFFREKLNKLTDTPSTLKYQSSTNKEGFITWQVNFTVLKPETKIAFNISTTNGDIKIINDNYKGHLLMIPYGVDFEGLLLVNGINTSYTTSITRISENEAEVLVIPDVLLSGNDVVVFTSETLFGLNQIVRYSQVIIDNSIPTINYFNISGFANNSFSKQTLFNITVNASDTWANSTQIYLNGIANSSGEYLSNVNTNTGFTIATDGNYTINVKVNDSAGNEINFSYFYNLVVDTTLPVPHTFNISGFVNNSFTNKNFFNVTVNASERYSDTALLFINDKRNASVRLYTNNSINITNVNIGEDGSYTFKVQINDSAGNEINFSYFYNLVIDTTNPTINYFNISGFVNNSITKQTNFNLTINSSDTWANSTQIYVNGVANSSGTYTSNIDTNISFSIGGDANYTIKVKVNDSAGNEINATYFYNLIVDTANPVINYFNISGYPNNGSNSSQNSFNITINITETHPDKVRVYVNDTINATSSYSTNVNLNATINLVEGYYKISVGANDTLGNNINATYFYNIQVDNTLPTVALISPVNRTVIEEDLSILHSFKFNSTELSKSCVISFNDINQSLMMDVQGNTIGIFNISTGVQTFNWIVNCTDHTGNVGQSPFFKFTQQLPTTVYGSQTTPQQPAGGGGNLPLAEQPEGNLTKTFGGFTIEFMCGKLKPFKELNTKNGIFQYDSSSLQNLQKEIYDDTGDLINTVVLIDYINGYERFCQKESNLITSLVVSPFNPSTKKINGTLLDLELMSFWDWGRLSIGKLSNYEDSNAMGVLTLLNTFFQLEYSDISLNAQVLVRGPRIIPFGTVILSIAGISWWRNSKKERLALAKKMKKIVEQKAPT